MNKYDVIIIGAGPAGIFAALELKKEKPELSILMLEKGNAIEKRHKGALVWQGTIAEHDADDVHAQEPIAIHEHRQPVAKERHGDGENRF